MVKTFDDWFYDNEDYMDKLAECVIYKYGTDAYVTTESLREIARFVWDESRQNMTTRDI